MIAKQDLQRPTAALVPALIAGCALASAATFLAINGLWLWLAVAGGVGAVLILMTIRPINLLLLAFCFLPFQSLLNDLFAGQVPGVAIAKDALMVVVYASTFLYFLAPQRRIYLDRTIYWFLFFAVAGAVYIAFSPNPIRAVLQLRFLSLYPLIMLLLANAVEEREDLNRLLQWIAAIGVVAVVYGLLQYLFLFDVPYRNAGGSVKLRMVRFGDELGIVSTFANRPTFGGYLVPLFLLFLRVDLWPSWRGARVLRTVMLGASGLCLVLTYSRSSWLGLLVGLLVVCYFYDKFKTILGGVALAAALIAFYSVQHLYFSAELTEATTSSESLTERLDYWPRVFGHVAANPLGLGLGMVGGYHLFEAGAEADAYGNLQSDPYTSFDSAGRTGADNILSVTDNAYLKLLVQGGFPLLLIFLGAVLAVMRAVPEVLRTVPDQWSHDVAVWSIASFAALLTICMFVDFFEAAPAIALYWLAIGVLPCLRKQSQI
ncbi:MAG TPA: O-antigen ligase family protein [Blastocatellia bacterium]|nr:O-antigen ligase family protein [Blastocatellia bacterium]